MRKVFLVLGGLILTISVFASTIDSDSCSEPGRLTVVCRTMKHLRSHIMILEAQRDLAQTNFVSLEKTLRSFGQSVVSLLRGGHSSVHLEKLETTRALAEKALSEARLKNPQAFKTAGLIKTTCQQCHNNSSPPGLTFEEIFKTSWGGSSERCNEPGRNPIVCRNMLALVAAFDVFMSASESGKIDFEFAEENAREIRRIVRLLQSFGRPIHEGGNGPLKEIETRAIELEELAKRRSFEIFQKTPDISRSCVQCHKVL